MDDLVVSINLFAYELKFFAARLRAARLRSHPAPDCERIVCSLKHTSSIWETFEDAGSVPKDLREKIDSLFRRGAGLFKRRFIDPITVEALEDDFRDVAGQLEFLSPSDSAGEVPAWRESGGQATAFSPAEIAILKVLGEKHPIKCTVQNIVDDFVLNQRTRGGKRVEKKNSIGTISKWIKLLIDKGYIERSGSGRGDIVLTNSGFKFYADHFGGNLAAN